MKSYKLAPRMVDIDFEVSDAMFLTLAKQAHRENITINELVLKALTQFRERRSPDAVLIENQTIKTEIKWPEADAD